MWGLLIIDYSFDTVHIVDGEARFDDKSRASEFGAVGRLSERRRATSLRHRNCICRSCINTSVRQRGSARVIFRRWLASPEHGVVISVMLQQDEEKMQVVMSMIVVSVLQLAWAF